MPQQSSHKKQKLIGQTILLYECGKSFKIWMTAQHGYAIFGIASGHKAMISSYRMVRRTGIYGCPMQIDMIDKYRKQGLEL